MDRMKKKLERNTLFGRGAKGTEKRCEKRRKYFLLPICIVVVSFVLGLGGCGHQEDKKTEEITKPDGIYLYGEIHVNTNIMKKELELWGEYYDKGMRDLFVELPYFDAQIMNIWMQSDNDDIFDMFFQNSQGTAGGTPEYQNFWKKLKRDYPETILHGTDIGHEYATTGQWYLNYLEEHGQKDSEEYRKTQENIEQGKYYYDHYEDDPYRENKMVENFVEEYETLGDIPVMGIYGDAHTDIDAMDYMTGTVPCMANQLHEKYGDKLHTESLKEYAWITEPLKTETIEVDGKDYKADYFGKSSTFSDQDGWHSMKCWRLEEAYQDFKEAPLSGEMWDQESFPMKLKAKQVYVVEINHNDGTVERKYFRTDPNSFKKMGYVKEFMLD